MNFLFFCWILFITHVAAAPLVVPAPSQDEFYKGPEGFEQQPLGTILRYRKTPFKLRSMYFPIEIKNSWDILVRSEDPQGNATAVVSTIIEPYNSDPKKLVAFSKAQDSSNFDCSNSYAIVDGAPVFANIEAQLEFSLFAGAALLSEGYYVVTTNFQTTSDYKSAFTAGRLAGQNILNSLIATLNTGNFTGLADPEVVLWGYSGGALASGWTAALMKDYAPSLLNNVIGAVTGGFPTNISTTVIATDESLFAGLVSNGVNGLMNAYPEILEVVQDGMTQQKYEDFTIGSQICLVPSLIHFAYDNFFNGNNSYFRDGLNILNQPEVAKVLLENTLAIKNGTEVPAIPLFIYHGIWDQIVPHINSQRVYDNWCASGAPSIEFATDLTLGHLSGFAVGIPAAAAWIKDRFDGKPAVSGCKATDYFSMLEYPGSSPELTSVVESFGTVLLGDQVGPNITRRDLPSLYELGVLNDETLAKILLKRFNKLK